MAKLSFIPRDMEFYDLFEQETANLVVAEKSWLTSLTTTKMWRQKQKSLRIWNTGAMS